MKKVYYLLILLLLPTACKTRHVVANTVQTKTTSNITAITKKSVTSIDTGKINTITKNVKNIRDSSEIDITPDSGTVQKINIAKGGIFTFTGKAKKISYKQSSADNSVSGQDIQINKGMITKAIIADSTNQQQTVSQLSKTKTTDAKADHTMISMVLVALAVIIIAGVIFYRIFKI